ncbi:winged helix DNA-binding domain-containing protein [Camelliibacillus cellulosilyticus]|uniref:Winged helix DNA-binding domain-containing protein n=1 Tax=Camelliibacillus cellulosilyticus TaxID=2174486 RepID=A0ABV9GPM9_9BACL
MFNTTISDQRLLNQHIDGEKFEKPRDVVKWMGAIQAQSYPQALWAIGVRMKQGTVAAVEQAIQEGDILRTWPMRGTIHFVPPEDAKWMLKLSAERLLPKDGRRRKQLGLDEALLKRCLQLFYDALNGNKQLTRAEMLELLEADGISTKNQRGYHILWYAALTGLICPGPMEGKQQTFVLLDEWVPDSRVLSREAALYELAKRYFASHGPATVHDFAWWIGLTIADAKMGLAAAKPELIMDKINGVDHWMGQRFMGDHSSGVHLLPGFDEYLLGYKDRKAVLADEHAQKVVPGKNGIFLPFIISGGQVVGTWKRTIKKKGIEITLSPFTNLDDIQKAIYGAAEKYCDFIGLPLLTIQ